MWHPEHRCYFSLGDLKIPTTLIILPFLKTLNPKLLFLTNHISQFRFIKANQTNMTLNISDYVKFAFKLKRTMKFLKVSDELFSAQILIS